MFSLLCQPSASRRLAIVWLRRDDCKQIPIIILYWFFNTWTYRVFYFTTYIQSVQKFCKVNIFYQEFLILVLWSRGVNIQSDWIWRQYKYHNFSFKFSFIYKLTSVSWKSSPLDFPYNNEFAFVVYLDRFLDCFRFRFFTPNR